MFVDVNNDGKVDLVVADDSTLSYLYINRGDGTFEDASYASGFGLNEDGREVAAMGVAVGDYLNNGLVDFAISDFSDEAKLLFHNDGNTSFTEMSMRSGIGKKSIPFLGWGTGFLDYDNDGWLDLMFVNGHIYPAADRLDWGTSYARGRCCSATLRDGKFEEVPPVKGSGLAQIISGRGAAFGDLFNDGKIDVVINPIEGPPVLLRNVNPDHHHWVELKLAGGPKSPRDAVGATVYLTANGMRQRQDVMSGGSYVSTNDPRPHFGLGDATDAGTAEIHWPSGAKETRETAGGRPHLHHHRRPRHHGGSVRRAAVRCEYAGRARARRPKARRAKADRAGEPALMRCVIAFLRSYHCGVADHMDECGRTAGSGARPQHRRCPRRRRQWFRADLWTSRKRQACISSTRRRTPRASICLRPWVRV